MQNIDRLLTADARVCGLAKRRLTRGMGHGLVNDGLTAASNDGPMPDSLTQLRDALRAFATERDWDQFHSPKNLAIALSVEAAELLEHFQWMGDGTSPPLSEDKRDEIRKELADVLLYLIRLADKLEVDPIAAANDKLKLNAGKYPADKARGTSKKYTEL